MSATVPPASPARQELVQARLTRALHRGSRRSSVLVFLLLFASTRRGSASTPSRVRPAAERGARAADEPSRSCPTAASTSRDEYRDARLARLLRRRPEAERRHRQRPAARPAGDGVPRARRARRTRSAGGSRSSCSSRRSRRSGSRSPPRSGGGSCPTRGRRARRSRSGSRRPAVLAATTISPAMTCATLIAGGGAAGAARARRPAAAGPPCLRGCCSRPCVWLSPLAAAARGGRRGRAVPLAAPPAARHGPGSRRSRSC